MLDTLGPARGVSVNRQMISAQAVASMTALVDGLATTFDGAVVFGGEQTALPPLDDYYADPPPPSRVAVRDAFLTRFGFGIDDPQAAGITPAQMDAFLDQAFLPLFSSPQWEDLWSNASTQAIVTRVSKNQVVPTSITANAQPFRDLAAAYTMMSDIGGAALNEGAYQRIVDRSLALSARAATGLAYQAAEIGTSEQLMKAATTRHETEIGLIDKRINEMESVDPFESASRAKALMDQLEVSYALTARIQNLSLVRFL
jgi:flagellar hook-associated protein 3 FlgL